MKTACCSSTAMRQSLASVTIEDTGIAASQKQGNDLSQTIYSANFGCLR